MKKVLKFKLVLLIIVAMSLTAFACGSGSDIRDLEDQIARLEQELAEERDRNSGACVCDTIHAPCGCGNIPAPCICGPSGAPLTPHELLVRSLLNLADQTVFSATVSDYYGTQTFARNGEYVFVSEDGRSEYFVSRHNGNHYYTAHDSNNWVRVQSSGSPMNYRFYFYEMSMFVVDIADQVNWLIFDQGTDTFKSRPGTHLRQFSDWVSGHENRVTELTVKDNGNLLLRGYNPRRYDGYERTIYINVSNPDIPPLPAAELVAGVAVGIGSNSRGLLVWSADGESAVIGAAFSVSFSKWGFGDFDRDMTVSVSPGNILTLEGYDEDWRWEGRFRAVSPGTVTITAVSDANPNIYAEIVITIVP